VREALGDLLDDPELGDENDPDYQVEIFRILRAVHVSPEGVIDKQFAAKYAEWLRTEPPDE
jgi:hypothetical protein